MSKEELKALWRATRWGWPMTRGFRGGVLWVTLAAATVLGLILAPWLIGYLPEMWQRVVAWGLVLLFITSFAGALAISPYLGQKAIGDDLLKKAQAESTATAQAGLERERVLADQNRQLAAVLRRLGYNSEGKSLEGSTNATS